MTANDETAGMATTATTDAATTGMTHAERTMIEIVGGAVTVQKVEDGQEMGTTATGATVAESATLRQGSVEGIVTVKREMGLASRGEVSPSRDFTCFTLTGCSIGETIAAGGNLPPQQMDDTAESSTQQFVPPTRESIMASRQNGTAGGTPAARKRVVPLIEVIANDRLGGKGNALDRNQCSPLLT